MPDQTREADMNAIRQKVNAVRTAVQKYSFEIERLRKDMEQTTGEARNAYRLVIQDKMRKMEHAVVCLSHSVIDHTIFDPVQPTIGEMSSKDFYGC
jgi:outer membrane murein-binding lipoprotein Lpp